MKHILTLMAVLIASMAASIVSSAQDIIHTYDSAPIKAEIKHIDDDYIHYKTWDNQDGPLYTMALSRVEKIIFKNGTIQIIPQTNQTIIPSGYSSIPQGFRRGKFYEVNGRISSQDIYDYIGYSLYGGEYMKARNQYTWGMSLTCIGLGGLIITAIAHVSSSNMHKITSMHHQGAIEYSNAGAIVGYAASVGCIGAGIPLWVKGSRGLHKIADNYNLKHGSTQQHGDANLSLGTTRNGLGLAFNF